MGEAYDVPDPPIDDFEDAYLLNLNLRDVVPGAEVAYDAVRRNLTVTGNGTVRLRGGTYFFNNFIFDGNGRLIVDAASKIYVTGRFRFDSSSQINFNGSPADLQFVAHPYAIVPLYAPPPDAITFNSSVVARFTLYAPGRNVTLNSSIHIYGAIVGKRVQVDSSTRIHYDRALLDAHGEGAVETKRLYWRDMSIPIR